MKKMSSLQIVLFSIFLGVSASSFAADFFLKFTNAAGESKIVSCPNGTCAVSDLAVGEYKVEQTDKEGKPVSNPLVLEHQVKSPRDAASGLATGKRQHKPLMTDTTGSFSVSITEASSMVSVQDHNSSRSNKTATK